jgi:transcriptional regulator with XRE-family HTH domain
MDDDNRLGEFLRARRQQVQPGDVGLPSSATAGRRRVQGLRREELAMLAGVSADYYIRLEQGRDRHPSDAVIDALAKVLRLDDGAIRHLRALSRPAGPRRPSRARPERAAPGLTRLLQRWSTTPAMVVGRCLDVLAHNPLAAALYAGVQLEANLVRMVFLDTAARGLYVDWPEVADDTVGALRSMAGGEADNPRLDELVAELAAGSDEFRRRWARHDVREKTSGIKRFMHPSLGEIALDYETLTVNGGSGQMLFVYHAAPGTAAERALLELARQGDAASSTAGAANGR